MSRTCTNGKANDEGIGYPKKHFTFDNNEGGFTPRKQKGSAGQKPEQHEGEAEILTTDMGSRRRTSQHGQPD
jgi:hypothetical protein